MRGLDQFFWINGKFWFGCQNWHSPGLLNTTKWRNSITFQDKYLFSIFQLLPSKSISSTVESYLTEYDEHNVWHWTTLSMQFVGILHHLSADDDLIGSSCTLFWWFFFWPQKLFVFGYFNFLKRKEKPAFGKVDKLIFLNFYDFLDPVCICKHLTTGP